MPARGFTLIEVLVAVLVFSVGLLGVAGLQLQSKAAFREAHERSTAVRHALDALERMRAVGRALPESEFARWRGALRRALPAADATLTGPTADGSGVYRIDIRWRDRQATVATYLLIES